MSEQLQSRPIYVLSDLLPNSCIASFGCVRNGSSWLVYFYTQSICTACVIFACITTCKLLLIRQPREVTR